MPTQHKKNKKQEKAKPNFNSFPSKEPEGDLSVTTQPESIMLYEQGFSTQSVKKLNQLLLRVNRIVTQLVGTHEAQGNLSTSPLGNGQYTPRQAMQGLIPETLANCVDALRSQEWSGNVHPSILIQIERNIRSGTITFSISDNGGGFPADLLPILGKERCTTKSTDSETLGRHGNFLVTARQLLEANGGKLYLTNFRNQDGRIGAKVSWEWPLSSK